MSCPISPCCSCLQHKPKKKTYAHVVYKSPDAANTGLESLEASKRFSEPDKIFNFPQPLGEFRVHPQVGLTPGIVSVQPRSARGQRRLSVPTLSHKPLQNRLITSHSQDSALGPHRRKIQSQSRLDSEDAASSSSGDSSTSDVQLSGHRRLQFMKRSDEMTSASSEADDEKVPILVTRETRTRSLKRRGTIENFESWVPDLEVIEETNLSSVDEGLLSFLQFSLFFDIERRVLSVHLQQAINLPAKDQRGTSDPFVVLCLAPNKDEIFESSIVYKTLNPSWDESFDFLNQTPLEIRKQSLVLKVYDHNKYSKNNFIGAIIAPLADADLYGMSVRMIIEEDTEKFREQSMGDLLLSLNYNPEVNVLAGVVLKAANLQKQDVTGLADPYVKVNLVYEDKRLHKWKSSVRRNTLLPIFNESFQFEVSGLDLGKVILQAKVMDHDRFSRDDHVGTVLIGESVEQESGKVHWGQVMGSPRQPISLWHSILPPVISASQTQN